MTPRFPASLHDLPAAPPPELLDEVDAAWERTCEMTADGRALHFEIDPLLGRVWAQLRSADGSVLEHLSAAEALAVACGDAAAAPALVA